VEIPGEKLLTKMWESLIDKGIGGLLTPTQIRREGRARTDVRREELVALAQAEKDAQDILAGRKRLTTGGQLRALPAQKSETPAQQLSSPKLLEDAASKFAAREVRRHVNLQRIAVYAEEQAQGVPDNEVSEEQVDDDWLNRWRQNAQDVSDEHMQRVWARILSEEVKSPRSYSMATLEFLRTLSKEDALVIASIGPYAIDRQWIFREPELLDRKGLPFGKLMRIQEMGIVSGVEAVGGLTRTMHSGAKNVFRLAFVVGPKALGLEREAVEPALKIPIYRITKRGNEILQLGDYQADDEYMKALGRELKKQGVAVTYGTCVFVNNKSMTIVDGEEL
jgi:hypothetical protein